MAGPLKTLITLLGVGIILLFYQLYKRDKIPKRVFKIFLILALLFGIRVRLYTIFNVNYTVYSDFKLYFDTAKEIMNGSSITEAWYLSFNGYVYVFSSILATFFKIIGASIRSAHLFNTLCQIGTLFLIYKFLASDLDKTKALGLAILWFLLPNVIEANLLVSTETLFLFLLMLVLYIYKKIKKDTTVNLKSIIKYMLFGLLISFSNNIRPVMLIFIITIILDSLINYKNKTGIILVLASIFTFYVANMGINKYVENGLNEPIRSGALEWSLYFGANFESTGGWSEKDSIEISKMLQQESGSDLILKDTIKKYNKLGIPKTIELYAIKFGTLWYDVDGNYDFLIPCITSKPIDNAKAFSNNISFVAVIMILLCVLKNTIRQIKDKEYCFTWLKIFMIGYILANLLIVVNGRYNYPAWLILILLFYKNEKREVAD